MLTSDLVRVRTRGPRIEVRSLAARETERLAVVADALVAAAKNHVGRTRGEFTAACEAVDFEPTDYKLVKGLRKLIEDRIEFTEGDGKNAASIRKVTFAAAASARRQLDDGETFDRDEVLGRAARELEVDVPAVTRGLFADLKKNHQIEEFAALTGRALIEQYSLAQRQAVLLRATQVVVEVEPADPGAMRSYFHRLKFLQLLHRIEAIAPGRYRVLIDGPFSLFRSVTKYGLQLALMLPALEACGKWSLEAEVRWHKDKPPYQFHLSGERVAKTAGPPLLPEAIARLMTQFKKRPSDWRAEPAVDVLELPGVGLCVPDLVFEHRTTGRRVFLEVMGHWSRDAVWKRVELVEAGLPFEIFFAVSSRLRVSEAVLADDVPGSLYVYKGAMSAKVMLDRLTDLLEGEKS